MGLPLAATSCHVSYGHTAGTSQTFGARRKRTERRANATSAQKSGPSELERVTGIEPALSAWEADVLPLNYTRRRPGLYRKPRIPGVVCALAESPMILQPRRADNNVRSAERRSKIHELIESWRRTGWGVETCTQARWDVLGATVHLRIGRTHGVTKP